MKPHEMPAVATPDNHWEQVTTHNAEVRDGPVLKRIGVPGGWLYITTTLSSAGQHPVFVAADRTDEEELLRDPEK